MKKSILLFLIGVSISLLSCNKDDGLSCTTCSSPDTATFEICQESDGTASINGENTGTPYEDYISRLRESGADCGY